MNICFLTQREVVPTIGGTERISSTLAHGLTERYGCQCYNLYNIPSGDLHGAFHAGMRYDTAEPSMLDKVEAKIREWGIDVLIHQDLFPELAVPLARMMHSLGKKYVYCVHFAPCYHRESFCLKALLQFCVANRSLRNFLKLPLYPYLKVKDRQRLSGLYRGICDGADRIVLLSERYIPEFRQLYGIRETARLCAVNNSLSFSEFITPPILQEKEPIVLIVCRMDERMKRISIALRIWREIEKKKDLSQWQLMVVGDGEDLPQYKAYVAEQGLRRVSFEGNQRPNDYYRRASLFMMTSNKLEGWGLTLTEAQQMGCVPLAFDSYAALHDIITDGYDGRIIQDGKVTQYAEALAQLMRDGAARQELALHAVESARRFEQDKIVAQWWRLVNEIKN